MNLKEYFLKQKAAVHRGTLDVYGKIPRDRLDWRPAEGFLTLGQIARHVWMSEQGNRRIALEDDWSYFETRIPRGLFAILGEVKSLDEELGEIARVHQETLLAVEAFPYERWEEIRENPQFQVRRPIGVMLLGLVEHHIHHRAQVGTYLRLLTGKGASPYAH
jgi:uncharacterized damage-inducible protein DinB